MEDNYNDTPENEQPVDEESIEEQSVDEKPAEEEETDEEQAEEEETDEEQAEKDEVNEELPEEQPVPAQSIYQDPNAGVVYEEPADQERQGQPEDQQTYIPPQKYQQDHQQNYQQNYNPNPDDDASPLSLGDSLILVILFAIPCVNLVVALIWAFGGTKSVNCRNLSRAQLIVWAAVLILTILFYVVFTVTIYNGLTS